MIMNINTFLLGLIVISTYLNLYLNYNKYKKSKKRTELPISSKQWNKLIQDNSFKSWLANKERLKK